MSAVHGPMPCTAVSSACASSAGSEASAARSSVPSSTALAIAFRVRIFAADRPMRWSLAGRARRTALEPNGSKAAFRRPQIAPALRRRAGARRDFGETRIGGEQRLQPDGQVGLAVDAGIHAVDMQHGGTALT